MQYKKQNNIDEKRKGFDVSDSSLFLEENVQEALLKAMLKKGLRKKLMELWNK